MINIDDFVLSQNIEFYTYVRHKTDMLRKHLFKHGLELPDAPLFHISGAPFYNIKNWRLSDWKLILQGKK